MPTITNENLNAPRPSDRNLSQEINLDDLKKKIEVPDNIKNYNEEYAKELNKVHPENLIELNDNYESNRRFFRNSRPDLTFQCLDFLLPNYGIQDFINDRAIWQKGTHNMFGEPAWYYFKVFFNFYNDHGLFSGIFDNIIYPTSAIRYLYGIREFYEPELIYHRMLALAKFSMTLSYINSVCPWFFIGLNGINKLNAFDLRNPDQEKSIELICNGDSVDMRLNTLLDMYKMACFDEINQKEIIPENLRKFDMSILLMQIPIKYFQTGIIVSGQNSKLGQLGSNGSTILNRTISGVNKVTSFITGSNTKYFDYKRIGQYDDEPETNDKISNMMSFQMYTLKNCEIDPVSFEGYMPSTMNNSQFFKIGTGAIKINYDRCYKHTYNEWNKMMYGSDGFEVDGTGYADELRIPEGSLLKKAISDQGIKDIINKNMGRMQDSRINAIQRSIYNTFFNKDTEAYKALIDFSESVINDSMINVTDKHFLGNIGTNYNANDYKDVWKRAKKNISNFIKI